MRAFDEGFRRWIDREHLLDPRGLPISRLHAVLRREGRDAYVHAQCRAPDVRRKLKRIARFADNDSARVGALREAVRTMAKEIELRQHLGQLPRDLGHVRVEWQA